MANAGHKPKPDPARLLVFTLLTQVNREGAYANLRLPELLQASNLDERDRAFATELAYGTLRMQGKHDALIEAKADRPFGELDPGIVDCLRMGIHQIFEMRVSDHAAVSESVEIARAVLGESKGSFINAILRAASSDLGFYERFENLKSDEPVKALSVIYSHPEWIVRSFYDALGDWHEVEKLLASDNLPAQPNLIAWPGKSTVDELVAEGATVLSGTQFGAVAHQMPGLYKAIRERRAGVQDRGSQWVAEIFKNTAATSAPLSWLDMCAGPGGKASALYNMLQVDRPEDLFTANEPSEHRARLVSHVIPIENVIVHRGQDLPVLGITYDRIIVDAPCTGLGALRRRPEARWRRTATDLKELVLIQKELLDAAVTLLNPGGVIAYVTCSPHIFETKIQVVDALRRHSELELLPIKEFLPSQVPTSLVTPDGSVQLWTHQNESDSMFMSLLRKKE
jgi:16S rRNA (cytosine967-C5)-methyltransferase